MKVLGIETSTKKLGVALIDGENILAEHNGTSRLKHSADLIPVIDKLLKASRLDLGGLDGFAVSAGPGSFTGLRIGAATLKGLNLATKKPIIAVGTMDALAQNIKEDNCSICVTIDAKKTNVYACLYAKKNGKVERKTDYLLIKPGELLEKISEPTIFIGDGISLYKDMILERRPDSLFADSGLWQPKAGVIAGLGARKLEKNQIADPDKFVPMYLYSKECSLRGVDR